MDVLAFHHLIILPPVVLVLQAMISSTRQSFLPHLLLLRSLDRLRLCLRLRCLSLDLDLRLRSRSPLERLRSRDPDRRLSLRSFLSDLERSLSVVRRSPPSAVLLRLGASGSPPSSLSELIVTMLADRIPRSRKWAWENELCERENPSQIPSILHNRVPLV